MATNSSAHTSELTDRLATSTTRAMKFSTRLCVTFPATITPIGNASASDSSVPSVAMCSVSMSAA